MSLCGGEHLSLTCGKSKEKNNVNAQKVQQVVQDHLKTHSEHPFVMLPHDHVNKENASPSGETVAFAVLRHQVHSRPVKTLTLCIMTLYIPICLEPLE